jgi:trimethylamine:corrinoid methyltransferase-like protein
MKLFRQMAFACTVSSSLPIGLLDNGAAFSPTQAMIDLDVNKALYGFGKGMEVTAETLCVDLIDRMEFCREEAYLQTDHTLRHFREVLWDTRLFDRTYRKEGAHLPREADARILREADALWRSLVASQRPPHREPGIGAEIDRIVDAARGELLS